MIGERDRGMSGSGLRLCIRQALAQAEAEGNNRNHQNCGKEDPFRDQQGASLIAYKP